MRRNYVIVSLENEISEWWTGASFDPDWKLAAHWSNLDAASQAFATVARRTTRHMYLARWVPAEKESVEK